MLQDLHSQNTGGLFIWRCQLVGTVLSSVVQGLLCLVGNSTFRAICCRPRVEISSLLHFCNGGLHDSSISVTFCLACSSVIFLCWLPFGVYSESVRQVTKHFQKFSRSKETWHNLDFASSSISSKTSLLNRANALHLKVQDCCVPSSYPSCPLPSTEHRHSVVNRIRRFHMTSSSIRKDDSSCKLIESVILIISAFCSVPSNSWLHLSCFQSATTHTSLVRCAWCVREIGQLTQNNNGTRSCHIRRMPLFIYFIYFYLLCFVYVNYVHTW